VAEIKKSLTIDATPSELFDIAEDPSKLPKFVPNVTDVVDIQRTDRRIGDSFRVIYKVLGVTFDEQFTTTEYDRPTYLTSAFKGGMTGTFRWTFEPDGRQCKVSVDIHYDVVGGALGKAVDAVMLERTNGKAIEGMLDNLRRMVVKAVSSGG
jgi:ribosome-associated toxin RatA of RatAB toxin-antitoxin module